MDKRPTLRLAICLFALGALSASSETLDICGLRFDLPEGWRTLELSQEQDECARTVERSDDLSESVDPHTLEWSVDIYVRPESLNTVTKEWGIRRRHLKWNAVDEREYEGLRAFRLGHWRGVSGARNARLYDHNGYVGMGQRPFTIASNGNLTIFLEAQPDAEDAIGQLISTARPTSP